MKRIIFIVLCLFVIYNAQGQDLIVTASGDSINCKITEVKTDAIFFSYDAGGNVISLPMEQIASYKYDFYKTKRSTPAVAVSMRGRSELAIYLGGGLSSLDYKPEFGTRNQGIGGLFGIGYTWFITGRWGIVTGIEASLYRAKYVADANYTGSHPAMSGTLGAIGNDFVFTYDYKNYEENQSALFMQIPVMAQFQTGRFFASAGIKIGIPAGGSFKMNATQLTITGEFPEQTYTDLLNYGFGNFNAPSYSGKPDLNIHYAAAIEAGGQWFLGRRTNLYVGAWFDYGLNNLSKTGAIGLKKPVIDYDRTIPTYLKYNSIIDTVEKISAMSAGLKLKLTYSL